MGPGRNDAQPGKAPFSAAEVGGSFVLQYYRTLTTDVENLHKYYKDESICSRGVEGASPDQITYSAGVDEIRETNLEFPARRGLSSVEINCIQSQESKQGGILVMVLGFLVYDNSEPVHFTQVFFLDKQTEPYAGYFVQNDILRYVTGKGEPSDAQAESPPPLLPPPEPPAPPTPAPAVQAPPATRPAVDYQAEARAAAAAQEAQAARDLAFAQEAQAAEDQSAAKAIATADASEAAEDKPQRSWATMAAEGNKKGWGLPPAGKGKAQAPAPATSSSTLPVLPPPSAAAKARAKAAASGEEATEVRLWVSKIPNDPVVENQELEECFKKLIADAGMEGCVVIDRRDTSKDSGAVTVSSQEIADMCIQHSKDRGPVVRGKSVAIRPDDKSKSSKGKGKGGNAEDTGDAKPADSGSKGGKRGKGGKGSNESGGGKGGKSGNDAGASSDKPAVETAGKKGGGRRGEKGKNGDSNWRNPS